MYRMADFLISKNLNKAEKMPNFKQWKVSETDRCAEGPILLYIRSKGYFFDRVCQPGIRYCVLTKRGFLLIYMKDEKGFVLDMRRAYQIRSLSDKVTLLNKKEIRRCRVKIRFSFGTVNIILTNGKIDLWRDRLLDASTAPSTMAVANQLALPPIHRELASAQSSTSMYGPMESVEQSPSLIALKSFSSSSEKELSKKENWAKVKTPEKSTSEISVSTAVDVSTCDDEYQYLSGRLGPVDEEFDEAESSTSGLFNYNSVRESEVPVGWLRRQLEHKIIADHAKRQPMYVAPPVVPTVESEDKPSEAPKHDKSIEHHPIQSDKSVKVAKKVKFSEKKSPVKANARSVPSDSCANSSFNSFQFWRSSIFESDV